MLPMIMAVALFSDNCLEQDMQDTLYLIASKGYYVDIRSCDFYSKNDQAFIRKYRKKKFKRNFTSSELINGNSYQYIQTLSGNIDILITLKGE